MSNDQATTVTNDKGRPGILLWVLIALFVGGVISLVYGWGNEDTQPDVGLLIVSYLFLLGVSQAGIVFCAMTRLVHAQWAKPYYRLAEFSTLAFFPFAILGFLLIYVYAQEDLFYWLSPGPDDHLSSWLNIDWLLIRNLFALLLFYGLSTYSAVKALKPDLAGVGAKDANHREIAGELYMLSPILLGAFVLCNTFIAWDFGMMLIPHWHSTVFPILYWFGNIFAGTAALILFPALLARRGDPSSPFGAEQVKGLGMMVTGFTLMWLYFFWAQFFVMWFGNLPHETDALWRQMYGHYGPYFWVMMTVCFFIPFVAFVFAIVKRSILAMCLIGLGINIGIWLYKYLTVVPVLTPDHQPFTSWLDITVAIGFAAGFVALVILLATRFPMYSRWEMALKPIPRR